ncbi:hypothetical protein CYMTET_35400 [Cymbomonas tetramitiformis]|uniref:Uncharacterized protein n=1 Tax=Cymbomonas tetramitiformis TaxID=36881 RepID=A0AAE0F9D1_9CHLO|nr:hypothetical protein CYMTET_35400 [Cymbomonas tetramitiformis]
MSGSSEARCQTETCRDGADEQAPVRPNVKRNLRVPLSISVDTQQVEKTAIPPLVLDVTPFHGGVPTSSTPTSESTTSAATPGGIMVPTSAVSSWKGPTLQAHGKQHGILTPYAHDLAVCLRQEIHRRIDSHHQSLNTLFDAMQFKSSSSEPEDLVLLMNSMPSTLHGD